MQDEWQRGIAAGIYKPMTRPCRKHGHTGVRYVTNNGCVECCKGHAMRQYRDIRDCPERWKEEKARRRETAI